MEKNYNFAISRRGAAVSGMWALAGISFMWVSNLWVNSEMVKALYKDPVADTFSFGVGMIMLLASFVMIALSLLYKISPSIWDFVLAKRISVSKQHGFKLPLFKWVVYSIVPNPEEVGFIKAVPVELIPKNSAYNSMVTRFLYELKMLYMTNLQHKDNIKLFEEVMGEYNTLLDVMDEVAGNDKTKKDFFLDQADKIYDKLCQIDLKLEVVEDESSN